MYAQIRTQCCDTLICILSEDSLELVVEFIELIVILFDRV